MHQTRNEVTKKIPIARKGTKYVARSLGSLQNSVPVVIAVREILNLARTAKEVKEMIKEKSLKLNGREVQDRREAIYLFNLLQAGKTYFLTLSPSGRFAFEEYKGSGERACKAIGKKIMKKGKVQLNFHDGTNLLTDKDVKIGDTVYIGSNKKIVKVASMEKGKSCLVISGSYLGKSAKINSVENDVVSVAISGIEKPISLVKEVLFVL